MTVVGAAVNTKTGQTWPQAIAEFETLTNRPLPVRRCYDSGVPTSVSTSQMKHDLGLRGSIWSFKPTITTPLATLEALASSIVTAEHPCDVIIYHEPVDNMSGPDFIALYQRSAPPFRDLGIPVGVCFTNWTCNLPYSDVKSAPRPYWPGDGIVDFIAIDEYPVGEITSTKDALPMEERTRRVSQFADAHGVELGLAEYGVDGTWDVIKSERWMRSVCDWAQTRAALGRPLRWMNYYSADVGGNWWLSNKGEFVDAYTDACRIVEG